MTSETGVTGRRGPLRIWLMFLLALVVGSVLVTPYLGLDRAPPGGTTSPRTARG